MFKVLGIAYLFLVVSFSPVADALELPNSPIAIFNTLLDTISNSLSSLVSGIDDLLTDVDDLGVDTTLLQNGMDRVETNVNFMASVVEGLGSGAEPLDLLSMTVDHLEKLGIDLLRDRVGLDIEHEEYDHELIEKCLGLFSPKLEKDLADMQWQNEEGSALFGLANKTIAAVFYPIKCQICPDLLTACQECPKYNDLPEHELYDRRLTEDLWKAIDNFGPTYLRRTGLNKDDKKPSTVQSQDTMNDSMGSTANSAAVGPAQRKLDEATDTCKQAKNDKSTRGYAERNDFFYSVLMSPLLAPTYPDFTIDFDQGKCNRLTVGGVLTQPLENTDSWNTRTNHNMVAAVLLAEAAVDTATTTLSMVCEAMPENVCITVCGTNPLKPLCWAISGVGQLIGQFFELLKSGMNLHDGVIDGVEILATLENSEVLIDKTCEVESEVQAAEALIKDQSQETRTFVETMSNETQDLVSEQSQAVKVLIEEETKGTQELVSEQSELVKDFIEKEANNTEELISKQCQAVKSLIQEEAIGTQDLVSNQSQAVKELIQEETRGTQGIFSEQSKLAKDLIKMEANSTRDLISKQSQAVKSLIQDEASGAQELFLQQMSNLAGNVESTASATDALLKIALSIEIKLFPQKHLLKTNHPKPTSNQNIYPVYNFVIASTFHDNGAGSVNISAVYAIIHSHNDDSVALYKSSFVSFNLGPGFLHIRADLANIFESDITSEKSTIMMFAMKAEVIFNGEAFKTTKLVPLLDIN